MADQYRILNHGSEEDTTLDLELTEEQYIWLSELFGRLNTAAEQYAPVIAVNRLAWHPVHGTYVQDNPRIEHAVGLHDKYPDPEGCPKCAEYDPQRDGPKTYDHDARPDDLPEPGDRCKECREEITWLGPSHADWLHVWAQDWRSTGSQPGESIEEQTKRLNDGPLRPCAFCQGPPDSTAGTNDGRRHAPDCAYHMLFGS